MFTFAALRRPVMTIVIAISMVAVYGRASAQTVTGTIFGKAADSSGAVVPGATVTVRSPQLIGGAQTRVTNEAGEFRFPAMPPGKYEVDFELAGFQTFHRAGIILEAGAAVAVDAVLQLATVQESLSVVGSSPMVDVKSSQMSEIATKELIENVPTGRTFVDVFNLMPGVVYGKYNVATTGTNSVHGGTVRNNVFSLDGVNVNDPLVAYPGTDVNLEMIEEVQITTAGMSAEFGSASGAVFNVITKSGGNTLSGQVNGYFRDRRLQSSNLTDDLRRQGVTVGTKLTRGTDWGGSVGGPVIRNRAWYFGNYQRLTEDRTVIGLPPLVTADQNAYFAKGTGQISRTNRVEGFYQYRLRYDEPFQPSVFEQDPRVWREQRQSNHTINSKWTSILSDSTFVEVRGSYANQRRFTRFPQATENDYGYIDSGTSYRSGGWYRELARPGYRNTRQVKADGTHFAPNWGIGTHDLKAGVSYDWLINSEIREWLAGARVHLLFNGAPDRIQLSNAPVNQKGRVNQLALYVQDQWTVSKRITVNLGVRTERLEGWYPQGAVGGVNFPRQEFPARHDVVNFDNIAPRLGVTFDPLGDRKTVLKATFGRYYNQVYTSEFDAAVPFAFGSKVYQWIDRNGDLVYQPGEEGTLISDSTVPAIGSIDPGVKQSYNQSATAGIERELLPDLSFSATFIVKKEYDLAETVNATLPFEQAYTPATLINAVTGAPITIYAQKVAFRGLPTRRYYTNPGSAFCSFCPDLVRKYRAIELTVRKRMKDRWQLFGSYVYGRSEGNKGTGHNESQGNVFGNPNSLVNAYGRLTLDRPHQIKVQGTYEAPFGIVTSASFTAQSGTPWGRTIRFVRANAPEVIVVESSITVLAEPVGTQRLSMEKDLSLRAEKRFQARGRSIGLILDVFNVFNAATVTALQDTRIDSANYAKPAEISLPRAVRLGARFAF